MIDATENEYRVYMEYAHGYALIMDKFLEGITRRFQETEHEARRDGVGEEFFIDLKRHFLAVTDFIIQDPDGARDYNWGGVTH